MKIKQKKVSKKYLAIGLVAIAVLIVVGVVLVRSLSQDDVAGESYGDAPSNAQIKAGDDIASRTDTQSNNGDEPNAVGSERPPAPLPDASGGKDIAQLAITSVNQNDGLLQIRTLISSISTDGTCTLTLERDGVVIRRTAKVQSLSSSSTCKGFDVPLSETPVGTWKATLNFENETLIGNTNKDIRVY